jgi:hypothetical protein
MHGRSFATSQVRYCENCVMSSHNRQRYKKRRKTRAKREVLTLTRHPFFGIDPEIAKAALAQLGKKSAEDFPSLLDAIIHVLREKNPLQILATLAVYGLQAAVSDEGVSDKSLIPTLSQHHIEIVQALVLALPIKEWGAKPTVPNDIQRVVDEMDELAKAFHQRRLKDVESAQDLQARTVLELQERLRLRTQLVRNWGYFSQVVKIRLAFLSSNKAIDGQGRCPWSLLVPPARPLPILVLVPPSNPTQLRCP